MLKVVPTAGVLSTVIAPPCARTMECTIGNPKPLAFADRLGGKKARR